MTRRRWGITVGSIVILVGLMVGVWWRGHRRISAPPHWYLRCEVNLHQLEKRCTITPITPAQ